VYRPENLAQVTGKLPVVAFGNGACANAGNAFENYLAEISSYGFLVVANGPINPAAPGRPPRPGSTPAQPGAGGPGPGSGAAAGRGARGPMQQSSTSQLYETMEWAKAQNDDRQSPYYQKLDVAALAVSGQSCGGLRALEAAGDPRVKTAVIFNSGVIRGGMIPGGQARAGGDPARAAAPGTPAIPALVLPATVESLKKIHTPIIYIIGGESDIAFKNAEADFADIAAVPVFKSNLDVGHNGTLWQPHGGKFAEVATQWLLWQLKGDQKAGAMFVGENCGLCQTADWKIQRKNLK
jgi:hypothetical protein